MNQVIGKVELNVASFKPSFKIGGVKQIYQTERKGWDITLIANQTLKEVKSDRILRRKGRWGFFKNCIYFFHDFRNFLNYGNRDNNYVENWMCLWNDFSTFEAVQSLCIVSVLRKSSDSHYITTLLLNQHNFFFHNLLFLQIHSRYSATSCACFDW